MKPTVKFGLLYAGLSIIWSLLMFVSGLNRSDSAQLIQTVSLAFPVICCVMLINEYKKGPGNGFMPFGKAFGQSMMMILIGTLIATAFSVVYVKYIDPTYMDFIMQKQEEKMHDKGMSDEMIEQAMQQTKMFMTPMWTAIFGLLGGLFIGAVIALIVSGILKKNNPEEIA